MSEGDSFLPPPPFNHLDVVISNPSLDGRVVMVSFTTHTPNEEQLCIIESGEHPFVNRKTAVRYKDARSTTNVTNGSRRQDRTAQTTLTSFGRTVGKDESWCREFRFPAGRLP